MERLYVTVLTEKEMEKLKGKKHVEKLKTLCPHESFMYNARHKKKRTYRICYIMMDLYGSFPLPDNGMYRVRRLIKKHLACIKDYGEYLKNPMNTVMGYGSEFDGDSLFIPHDFREKEH